MSENAVLTDSPSAAPAERNENPVAIPAGLPEAVPQLQIPDVKDLPASSETAPAAGPVPNIVGILEERVRRLEEQVASLQSQVKAEGPAKSSGESNPAEASIRRLEEMVSSLQNTVQTEAGKPADTSIRRLEEAVAALQDTRGVEERIVEKIVTKIGPKPANPMRDQAGALIDAGRRILPVAAAVVGAQVRSAEALPAGTTRSGWLFIDFYVEVKDMVRMYLDPVYRYQMSWTARVVPFLLLIVILTSQWTLFWIFGVPAIGPILLKFVDIPLAFVAYKILSREAHRYRQTLVATRS